MTVSEFMHRIQDYVGGQYTKTQAAEVSRWLERETSDRLRNAIYRYAVIELDTQFKTPPSVKKLMRFAAEAPETFPEIMAHSYNRRKNVGEIEEDAGIEHLDLGEGELWEKVLSEAAEKKGVTPDEFMEKKRL